MDCYSCNECGYCFNKPHYENRHTGIIEIRTARCPRCKSHLIKKIKCMNIECEF